MLVSIAMTGGTSWELLQQEISADVGAERLQRSWSAFGCHLHVRAAQCAD